MKPLQDQAEPMNRLYMPHQRSTQSRQFGTHAVRTWFVFSLFVCVCLDTGILSTNVAASEGDPTSKAVAAPEAESSENLGAKKPSKLQQKRLARQQQRELRKSTPPAIHNKLTTGSLLNRWSIGSQPYGYDHLGYPDPYFCFPYSLDPWERGSFRAPDLLDDPYFYDRVPVSSIQRHRRSRKLQTDQHATTIAPDHAQVDLVPQRNAAREAPSEERPLTPESYEVLERLETAASTLAEQLLRYPKGEQWVTYLQPNMLPIMAANGQYDKLNQLLTRYDQTFVQPEVQTVSAIEGFAQSRKQLRRFLQSVQ